MIVCPECFASGTHEPDCALDPAKPRVISRRSFFRSAAILTAALYVAPSLVLPEPASKLTFAPGELDAILKSVYTQATFNMFPMATPLADIIRRQPKSLLHPAKQFAGKAVYFDMKFGAINP